MPVTLNTSDPDFETGFAAMLAAKREDEHCQDEEDAAGDQQVLSGRQVQRK